MVRDIYLVSYLPAYLKQYEEVTETLAAENPEFVYVWDAADRVLKNMFIETADEYGLSRFERALNILPSREDTIESRRTRVQSRWFISIPYTMRSLVAKLITLCGDTDFTIVKRFDYYRLEIITDLELFGQVDELGNILDTMLPCNIIAVSMNKIPCNSYGAAFQVGGICSTDFFFITNDGRETITVKGPAYHSGGIVNTATVFLTNDSDEQVRVTAKQKVAAGTMFTEIIEIN